MEAKECVVVGNTSYGYCFSPITFPSIRKAKEYAKEMLEQGYWFAFSLSPKK